MRDHARHEVGDRIVHHGVVRLAVAPLSEEVVADRLSATNRTGNGSVL
jgi:hypothetical protein